MREFHVKNAREELMLLLTCESDKLYKNFPRKRKYTITPKPKGKEEWIDIREDWKYGNHYETDEDEVDEAEADDDEANDIDTDDDVSDEVVTMTRDGPTSSLS